MLNLPPPADHLAFTPSELFRFFFQIGRWTEESFSTAFQSYTRGKLISTVTINKWKNRDVIPTRYSGPLFKMIEDQFEPQIAKDWITAFETVWATHVARPRKTNQNLKNTNFSDAICRQHKDWIHTRYIEKLYGESFSASDIYVPLQLRERDIETKTLFDIEDLLTHLVSDDDVSKKQDWAFICGGPGSGKSMAALHLAQETAKIDIFPIYLRCSHLSQIPIDIQNTNQPVIDSFSVQSFLQHFRSSSQKSACLILDGIDEIPIASSGTAPNLNQILATLISELNICRAHGKRLHVIALGRSSHIEYTLSKITRDTSRTFDMLGLDGRYPENSDIEPFGRDLRADWWNKYLSATGSKSDPSLPDFLSIDYDDYSDFSTEPLLTYLICRTALNAHDKQPNDSLPHEAVNQITYAKNRNQIYQNIVEHIHTRTSVQSNADLEFRNYRSVLQHIALAIWHNNEGRTVSLKQVQACIRDKEIETAFLSLKQTSPDMLMTAFYYRVHQDENSLNQTLVEFTHKTFSEYLVSTLILDRFLQLITAFTSEKNVSEALNNWSRLTRAGEHDPTLADFCQKEAALRYETISALNWDCALTVIDKHLNIESQDVHGINAIASYQRAASLLFFIWSCLNLERHKRTQVQFNLSDNPYGFSSLKIKQIQLINQLTLETDYLPESRLQTQTFLTPSFSALNLTLSDMSQVSFSMGHIESLTCKQINFAMTHWSHVKISKSDFHKSIFQQTIFHGNRCLETKFSNCLFQAAKIQLTSFMACQIKETIFSQCHFSDVDFISVDMEGVIFDRCTFANCRFDPPKKSSDQPLSTFRYCSFLDMEASLKKIPNFKFEACIFPSMHQKNESLNKNTMLERQIEEFLH